MPVIDPEVDTHKICSKCREPKTLDQYQKNRSQRDGLQHHCKPCQNGHVRHYQENNRETLRLKQTEYVRANPEKIKAYNHTYKRGPRQHKLWESSYRLRAYKQGLHPVILSFTKAELIEAYGDACVDCGGEWTDVEHVVPVSAGGEHSLENCRPVCAADNKRRWREWRKEHPELDAE